MKSVDIAKALITLLERNIPEDQVMIGFEKFIQKNHLQGLVSNIIWYMEYFYKESEKNKSLEIITAHEISKDVIESISNFIQVENNPPVKNKINKEIIGGFIAYYSGKEYDASIKKQLSRLKQAIIYS